MENGELIIQPVVLKAGETATIKFRVKVLPSALNATIESIAIAYDSKNNEITTPPAKTEVVQVVPDGNTNTDGNTGTDGNTNTDFYN
ncbi:hypothetical protein VYF65_000876 [Lysinibacillus irui]|uniref:hypothetical protein n=1 Tax=Lysinibacillus irui TaxID=2998077 RepID=UPI003883F02C